MQANGFRFSRQEEKVLAYSMAGLSDKEIAYKMGIGLGTVRTFWKRIRSKAGGSSRNEVISAMSRVVADQELEEVHEQNIQLIAEIKRRQEAEEAARRREREFSTLAEAVPSGVFKLVDGRFAFINEHAVEWSGMSRQYIDENQWAAIDPSDVPKMQEQWDRALESGEPFEAECRARHKDGTYRWCLIRAVREDSEDESVRWVGTITDIHNIKAAEVLYRSLFDCSLDPVFLVDAEGRIVDTNQAASEVLGYSKRELLSMTTYDLVVPGMEAAQQQAAKELREAGSWRGVFPVKAKSGLPVQLEWSTNNTSFPNMIFTVARQIVEPRPIESEDVYEQAFERARVALGVVDEDGAIKLANERFTDLLGHQTGALAGHRLPSLVTFSDRKRLDAATARADTEGDAQVGLSMLHANGGLISVLMDVSSIQSDGRVVRRIVTLRRTADSSRRY